MADVRVTFEPDIAGIREILHCDGVHVELGEIASAVGQAANGGFQAHFPSARVPGYATAIDEGKYTSLGVVYTQTKLGMVDEAKYHTLEAQNH